MTVLVAGKRLTIGQQVFCPSCVHEGKRIMTRVALEGGNVAIHCRECNNTNYFACKMDR